MNLGITAKLFLAFVLTNLLTAIAIGLGSRAAFTSGFTSYVNEREDQRLARLAGVLASAFRERGDWEFLRGNDALWVALNHTVRGEPREAGAPRGPPPLPPPEGREGKGRGPGGDRPPPSVLFDLKEQRVAGSVEPSRKLLRRPVVVDGAPVGWLAVPERHGGFDALDRRFQEEQLRAGWIVGAAATGLAAIVALFLANGLLAPVKRLASATRRLAGGEYATRVAPGAGDELGRLVEDFNRLGNTLEKNESLRRHFMADVSHELRTPLAVLKGELEALEDGVRPLTAESLRSLQAEVAILSKLVSDLHDLSLADVGGLAYRYEEVDLADVVRTALHGHRVRLAAQSIAVEVNLPDAGLAVRGDPQRLAQLVHNLLENSIRYTDAGGRLCVALRSEAHQARLTWDDSNPGVPAEALPRLFERLFRVEASRNRGRGGSGLGLAIAKSVVEAHGGAIAARDSDLGGLRIEVTLPLATE